MLSRMCEAPKLSSGGEICKCHSLAFPTVFGVEEMYSPVRSTSLMRRA